MAPGALAGLEVDAACATLHELLHIPRRLLGSGAPMYRQLLLKVRRARACRVALFSCC